MTNHLNDSDMASAWCGHQPIWSDSSSLTSDIDECDCHACLDAVLTYAGKAMSRKFNLTAQRIAEMKASRK